MCNMLIETNQIINQGYVVEECIGQGVSSSVWKGVDLGQRHTVALKFYTNQHNYHREARMLTLFNCESIVRVLHHYPPHTEWPAHYLSVMECGEASMLNVFQDKRPIKLIKLKIMVETLVEMVSELQNKRVGRSCIDFLSLISAL